MIKALCISVSVLLTIQIVIAQSIVGKQQDTENKPQKLLQAAKQNLAVNPQKALKEAHEALEEAKKYAYTLQIAEASHLIGMAYTDLGDYELALKYLLNALNICEKQNNPNTVARLLNDISSLYRKQKNGKQAAIYLKRVFNQQPAITDPHIIATTLHNFGRVHFLTEEYDIAYAYTDRARAIRASIRDTAGLLLTLNNLGVICSRTRNYQKAMRFFEQSVQLNQQKPNFYMLSGTLDNIGDVYFQQGNMPQAFEYYRQSRDLALQTNSKERILESYQSFTEYYEKQGLYQEALFYQKRYNTLKDSLFNSQRSEQIARMQAAYDTEAKERENALLIQEKKLKENQLITSQFRLQRQIAVTVAIAGALGALVVISLILYRYNQTKHKTNHELLKLNQEISLQADELMEKNEEIRSFNEVLEKTVKDRTQELQEAYRELDVFLYRASHDLSRPIAALLGIREMAYLMTEDKQILDLFDLSRKTILGMDRMARKLQSISEITSTQHTEDVLDFSLIFGEIWLRLRVLLAEKKNEIISDLDLPRLLVGTPYFVTVILENLIENALLFGYPDTGVIQLSIKELNQTLLLEVKDNGKGIDPKYQAHIFDMYFRAHETSQGNGLGLYVVRKITEKCKGKIEFESQVGVGSAFRVTIPVGYSVQN